MGLLVNKTDFVGKYSLAKSNTDFIDDYIQLYEEKYLIELFGLELFLFFKADINVGTKKPNTAIYLTLYNPLVFKYSNRLFNSFGIKNLLLAFIFFHYVRENRAKQTQNGTVSNQTEVSDPMPSNDYIYLRYNEAVEAFWAIQAYCEVTKEGDPLELSYPTFDGICKRKSSPF